MPKGKRPKAGPTRVFKYGARVDPDSEQAVFAQLRLAHQYRNKWVEIERTRRTETDQLLKDLSPRLAQVEQDLVPAKAAVEAARDAAKAERIKNRNKRVSKATTAVFTAAKAVCAPLFAERKALRDVLFADPVFQQRNEAINATYAAAIKTARATFSQAGLYFGTYLCVEQAAGSMRQGAPPDFHRFSAEGRIAVQVQKGCPVSEVFAQASRSHTGHAAAKAKKSKGELFLQIDPKPNTDINPWRPARFRIGSTSSKSPIWANLQVKIHRDMPADGRVKWVWLMADRVGVHVHWTLQVVVERDVGWAHPDARTNGGIVAVDVGWRLTDDGMRVAYWVGDDGKEGQVIIPTHPKPEFDRLARLHKVEDLHSIRDKRFNGIKAVLAAWLKATTPPQWLSDRLQYLHSWKAQARLASVVIAWRTQRFNGDTAIFDQLEAWRKNDKHLLTWEAHQRQGAQDWRKNLYREVAARLSRQYSIAAIEHTDWRVFDTIPDVDKDQEKRLLQFYRRTAAVSIFNSALTNRMTGITRVPAEWTTQMCHACQHVDHFDAARHLVHTCSACGATWDQDRNACLNILRLAGGGLKAKAASGP